MYANLYVSGWGQKIARLDDQWEVPTNPKPTRTFIDWLNGRCRALQVTRKRQSKLIGLMERSQYRDLLPWNHVLTALRPQVVDGLGSHHSRGWDLFLVQLLPRKMVS